MRSHWHTIPPRGILGVMSDTPIDRLNAELQSAFAEIDLTACARERAHESKR